MKIKLPTNKTTLIIAMVLFILVVVMAIGVFSNTASPLDQYITWRNCDFLQLGNFSVAACTDGTTWGVSPWQP